MNIKDKRIGIMYGTGKIGAGQGSNYRALTIHVFTALALLFLLICGGLTALAMHMYRKPMLIVGEEQVAAYKAWKALLDAANGVDRKRAKADEDIDKLGVVKKEHALQADQVKLMDPIRAEEKKVQEPYEKRMEPMNKAIADSQARIAADPAVKALNDAKEKYMEDLKLPQMLWTAVQNSMRAERGLRFDCNVDTDNFEQFVRITGVEQVTGKPKKAVCEPGK